MRTTQLFDRVRPIMDNVKTMALMKTNLLALSLVVGVVCFTACQAAGPGRAINVPQPFSEAASANGGSDAGVLNAPVEQNPSGGDEHVTTPHTETPASKVTEEGAGDAPPVDPNNFKSPQATFPNAIPSSSDNAKTLSGQDAFPDDGLTFDGSGKLVNPFHPVSPEF